MQGIVESDMTCLQMTYSCLKEEVRLLQQPVTNQSPAGPQLLSLKADQVCWVMSCIA